MCLDRHAVQRQRYRLTMRAAWSPLRSGAGQFSAMWFAFASSMSFFSCSSQPAAIWSIKLCREGVTIWGLIQKSNKKRGNEKETRGLTLTFRWCLRLEVIFFPLSDTRRAPIKGTVQPQTQSSAALCSSLGWSLEVHKTFLELGSGTVSLPSPEHLRELETRLLWGCENTSLNAF